MADLSKIKVPDGTEYDIKDSTARSGLSDKMDKANPTGTGSLSINRKSGTTTGSNSVAVGENCTASGGDSFACGYNAQATGTYSHAEGYSTKASGAKAHAEGTSTTASGSQAHAEGNNTYAYGTNAHAEGYYTYAGTSSNSKNYSHAEGYYTQATGEASHAEGKGGSTSKVTASGEASHAEGFTTTASGIGSHAEGRGYATYKISATGNGSHAEGHYNDTSGAITKGPTASGKGSHAEGFGENYAYGIGSHAEGYKTVAGASSDSNDYSHAEGDSTTASGEASHSEGTDTIASGLDAHAEGFTTTASGQESHSEGAYTVASGQRSHSEGDHTIASGNNQHVSGTYNIEDSNSTYAEIIGNGTADNARSNARTLDWGGNEWVAGELRPEGNVNFINTNNVDPSPGIYWKEQGYGDKFKIAPQFAGTGEQNKLTVFSAIGGQGEDPACTNVAATLTPNGRLVLNDSFAYKGTTEVFSPSADATKTNNDLSIAEYDGVYYKDKNGKVTGKSTLVYTTDGAVHLETYVKNYNTSGSEVGSNTYTINVNNSGTPNVTFSHPWAWLSALGLYPGMKTSMKSWGPAVKIRQSGGDWMCIIMCENSIYTVRGGGGNHATMTPTLKLLAGTNMDITQTVTHSTNYSEFTYARSSNAGWVVFSFSNATANHEIIWL